MSRVRFGFQFIASNRAPSSEEDEGPSGGSERRPLPNFSPSFFMAATADSTNAPLSFSGHEYFRQRLVLSILSGRPVRIDKIRSADANPGLRGPSI